MCKGPGAGPGPARQRRRGRGRAGQAAQGLVGLRRTGATWAFNPEGGRWEPGRAVGREGREGPVAGARRSPSHCGEDGLWGEGVSRRPGLCRCRWVMAGAGSDEACAPTPLDPFFTFASASHAGIITLPLDG